MLELPYRTAEPRDVIADNILHFLYESFPIPVRVDHICSSLKKNLPWIPEDMYSSVIYGLKRNGGLFEEPSDHFGLTKESYDRQSKLEEISKGLLHRVDDLMKI